MIDNKDVPMGSMPRGYRLGYIQMQLLDTLRELSEIFNEDTTLSTNGKNVFGECKYVITKFKPFDIYITMSTPYYMPVRSNPNRKRSYRFYTIEWMEDDERVDKIVKTNCADFIKTLEEHHVVKFDRISRHHRL